MRKEIQAAEWLLLGVGIVLLLSGSVYLQLFVRVFQIYYFLMTFGIGVWIATRYLKRYKKKNVVVFHLRTKDPVTNSLMIKSIQLFIIVGLSILYYEERNLILPVILSFVYFTIQISKFGNPKLVFHNPNLFKDAIYFERLSPQSFEIFDDGILIHDDEEILISYDDLDDSKFRKEMEFEDNHILDDVLLTDGDNECIRNFIHETKQYAAKLQVPVTRREGDLLFG